MVTDKQIINSLNNIPFKRTKSIFNRLTDEEQKYVLNRYNDSLSIKETFYRIKNNIEIRPVCKHCGKEVEFCRNGYFRDFCCLRCSTLCEETKAKRIENSLLKWGTEFPSSSNKFREKFNNTISNRTEEDKKRLHKIYSEAKLNIPKEQQEEIRKKAKQTKLERYGDENYCNSTKAKQTKLERYGKYVNIEKYKKSMLEKYGVEFPIQSKEIRERTRNTILQKYGVEYPAQSPEIKEKIIQTNLKKYGVKYASQLDEIKEKQKKTCLEKYGVDTFFKANKLKECCHSEETNKKRNKTNQEYLKENKFSKDENICYSLLQEKYTNIIRQYTSDLYNFNCDFYIPEIDTYIEYNGSQFHHFHPFNENNKNDIKELNRLKELDNKKQKNGEIKNQYNQIIYTWTDLDIRKRNIAKENNLNFIEFWNIDEVKEWVKNK